MADFLAIPAEFEDELIAFLEPPTQASERMLRVCYRVWHMLDAKNRAYGNSALEPVRVFSRADSVEQIRVRLDDKLSRLARGTASGEDVVADLMGYLVLLKVAEAPWEARVPAGQWRCAHCANVNENHTDKCDCGRWRPLPEAGDREGGPRE